MGKTFHRKSDGATVVRSNGKIVDNLAAPTAPAAMPTAPVPRTSAPDTGTAPTVAEAYQRFQSTQQPAAGTSEPALGDVAMLDLLAAIDDYTPVLADLKALPDDATVLVADLPLSDLRGRPPEARVSRKDAIDLVRAEQAVLREEYTNRLIEAGVVPLREYGDGPLGQADAVGTFEPNSREWLMMRAFGLGGSDKIGIVDDAGVFRPYPMASKRSYLHTVLGHKTAQALAAIAAMPEDGDAGVLPLPIEIGNRLERTVQAQFAITHPEFEHYTDKSSRVADGRPHHRFNPDGVLRDAATGEWGLFEAKTARDAATFDAALPGYRAQCLHNAAAADLPFAVLVADIDGEAQQRVIRLDFSAEQRAAYRAWLDRVWFVYKPAFDRRWGMFR